MIRGGPTSRALWLAVVCVAGFPPVHAAAPRPWQAGPPQQLDGRSLSIPAGSLAQALESFSMQTGLQVVYDPRLVHGHDVKGVAGAVDAGGALDDLLLGTGLLWARVDDMTVVVRRAPAPPPASAPPEIPPVEEPAPRAPEHLWIVADPHRVLPPESSALGFGFQRSLLDTPRAISVISSDTIDLLGLSAAEDLTSVAPGVFTTTRFGIQGAVDVRNVPADTYFRGMKRLTLQGHGRSVLAAMDTIEVVGGPPSPLYGMGKIGGFTNVVPKSGRAADGGYLERNEGFLQFIGGSYDRREVSFGLGGPLSAAQHWGRTGGFYVYGLVEDSGSYTDYVPVRQRVLQLSTSVDDLIGAFRLESGIIYQRSKTAGALTGRLTQALVDDGTYIRGSALVNLDADGNGEISYAEMNAGSPVQGPLDADNQPLMQTWNWPRGPDGAPLPLGQFPSVPGIPAAMHAWLMAHPEADPGGWLRAQGPGGPLPVSGAVPVGMSLDPRSVGYGVLPMERAAAFEKELQADFVTAYLDLVSDRDPRFTIRNQLFFDSMDQYKDSRQPFVQEQDVYVIEDKLTVTRRLEPLPDWLQLELLGSLNLRHTVSRGRTSGTGDFSNSRTDALSEAWNLLPGGMTSNETFASPRANPDPLTGYPWQLEYSTAFTEAGLGALADASLGGRVQVMLGARYDYTRARNTDHAGTLNPNAGTAASPGVIRDSDATARATDGGASLSASITWTGWPGWRPYVTWSRSTVMLDGNNNSLTNAVIEAGPVGRAELREVGVKARLLDQRLLLSFSAFRQARIDVDATDDRALLTAYATATVTRGWEAELKWVPMPRLFLSMYASRLVSRFEPNVGSTQIVDARALGFQDVLDDTGRVVYPAEAFLYGGRARLVLPDGMPQYARKQGNPDTLLGLNLHYRLDNGIGLTTGVNYFSSTCSGRLCWVRLPASTVARAGAYYERDDWMIKFDVLNLTDERYFRARTGDTLGNVLSQAMPGRRCQLTVRRSFSPR